MNPDRAVALLKGADPATDPESIELPYASGAAYLAALEQRSGTMKTHEEVRELPGIDTPAKQPGGRWRGPLIAAAAAVVALIVVGVGLLLFTDGGDPAPVVDEPVPTTTATEGISFGRDPVLVGDALTAAYNGADGISYLGLFAADARLVANGYETSLDELRTAFEVWDLPMAQRLEWTDCELRSETPFGARVECAVTITSDWLAPGLEPIDAVASIVVADGEITQYTITEQAGAHDATLRPYRDWTFANYPDQAPLMWRTERTHAEVVFSTESTGLHTRLGVLYLQYLDTPEPADVVAGFLGAVFAGEAERVQEFWSVPPRELFGEVPWELIADYYGALDAELIFEGCEDAGARLQCSYRITHAIYEAAGVDAALKKDPWTVTSGTLTGWWGDELSVNRQADAHLHLWARANHLDEYEAACPNWVRWKVDQVSCAEFHLAHLDEWVTAWNADQLQGAGS